MAEKEAINLARRLVKEGEEVKIRIDGHGDWCVYTVKTKKIIRKEGAVTGQR